MCELPTWGFSLRGPTYFYLRGARGTGPHHRHNRFWGEATGVSKAEGHRSVLTLFLTPRPNPFHPSPSALRWPPLPSHRLTEPTTAAASQGGHPPASQPPAGRGNTAPPQTPHLHSHQSLRQPWRRSGMTGDGPASAAPAPEEKAGSRAGRTKGRGRMRTNRGRGARESGTCGGGRARRADPALNSFKPHLPSSIFILFL